jgi:hypothetical protein
MVGAGGSILAKKIRKVLPHMVSDEARSKSTASRRKARNDGTPPLVRTIRVRTRSKGRKGIVYAVVGPAYPAGAHGHLVEFGHAIVVKGFQRRRKRRGSSKRSGGKYAGRAKPVPFQSTSMRLSQMEIYWGMATRLKKWLAKQDNPHLKGNLRAWL